MDNWVIKLFKSFTSCFGKTFGAARDSRWNTLRKEFLIENPICAVCEKQNTILNPLNIHHIIPVHVDKGKELDKKNLITLCKLHHFWFGHLGSWWSYNENIIQDAEEWNYKIKKRP